MLIVYHCTTEIAAQHILADGFRDNTARYLTDRVWTGVWVSDRPLDNNEGASGDTLLQIDVAEETWHSTNGGRRQALPRMARPCGRYQQGRPSETRGPWLTRAFSAKKPRRVRARFKEKVWRNDRQRDGQSLSHYRFCAASLQANFS